MSEGKKNGGALGKFFIVICLLICIAALAFSVYLGGQKKTAESYYTAVIRDDYSSFAELFAGSAYSEALTENLRSGYKELSSGFKLDDTSLMHVRINFRKREFLSLTENRYFYTVTYYDDDINSLTTDVSSFLLRFEDGKWKISG